MINNTSTLLNSRDNSYSELFKRNLKNPIIVSKDLQLKIVFISGFPLCSED